jgi:hypothetical protein
MSQIFYNINSMKINIYVFSLNFKIIISKISPFVFINEEKNVFKKTEFHISENT